MLILIGVLAGLSVSIIGSLFFGMIPAFWFFTLFKLTIIQSILVFIILTYKIKPTFNQRTNWLYSFCSLLIITLISFVVDNISMIIQNNTDTFNWDSIIIYNILYSIGAALIASPLGYIIIKMVANYKTKKLGIVNFNRNQTGSSSTNS